MAKILVLSFRFPYPVIDGNRIRTYNICRILAKEHILHLVSLERGKIREAQKAGVSDLFDQIVSYPFKEYSAWINAFRGLMSKESLQSWYFYFRNVQKWIDEHESEYDLIFLFHLRTSKYIQYSKIPKAADLIDATSINYREAMRWAKGIWKVILPIEIERALSGELNLISSVDRAFITSKYDKNYLENHLKNEAKKIMVVPNGVREDLLVHPIKDCEEDWIVFLGTMDYAPNEDAVCFFAREIFPIVLSRIPSIKFIIVGRSPSKRVLRLGKLKNIVITGFVKDPYYFIERAKVVIAPLRFSAGIQNKILEAMALGKAVVTTSKGARGIIGANPDNLVVEDDPKEMARAIIGLLNDKLKRIKLGNNARFLIKDQYRWDKIGDLLLSEIRYMI